MKDSKFFIRRESCPVCGSNEKELLFKSSYDSPMLKQYIKAMYELPDEFLKNEEYEIDACKECGLIWQPNVLNDKGAEILYTTYKKSDDMGEARSTDANKKIYMKQIADALRSAHKKPSKAKVLDYGMGWGYWCAAGKEMGCDSYGFEISETYRDFAKKNGINVLERSDIAENAPFDVINLEQVLEHVPNPREIIEFLSSNLSDNGVLIIGVPNGGRIRKDLRNPEYTMSKDSVWALQHINTFNNATLAYLTESVGLVSAKLPFRRYLKNCARGVLMNLRSNNLSIRVYLTKEK